ncbi:hypothetical protein P12x_002135 [Tundrisphaera lichenicola]|uniref:hypothetical protein n=1 Tax=Tundrisphaera lichenicola TaxID=2029860 RepID=UPI003EC0DD38
MHDRLGWKLRTRAAMALALALVAISGTSSTALGASRAVEVENVRVGFQERYKVGTWTPVWIQLRGGLDGFNGILELVAQDEDGSPTTIGQSVQVAPGGSQRVTAYVRPGSLDPDFATIRFIDGKSGRRVANDVPIGSMIGNKPPEPLDQLDYQIITLGRPAGVDIIPTMPGYNVSKNSGAPGLVGRAREVSVARLEAIDDLLPGRWYGFDAVDVAVIDTNDKELMATLNSGRGEALRQWVERGGHLVVAASSNWQSVNDSLLAPMLPARLNGQIQVSPFDSLESFTGGSHQVAFENTPVQVARLEDIESRGGKVIASTLSTPLVVRGPYGFGRVTLIALDADTKPFAGWPDRGLFWIKALDLKGASAGVEAQKAQARIIRQDISDMATLVRRGLDQFAGVTLIPFGWVAGFIMLYILLIGPGDYFFLKKVLKRMELTWITFPTIVIAVSLLAYYAAYVVKGTDLRVNKMDVVDVDLQSGRARGTSWINLFSPQNRDYSITAVPLLPDRDPPTDPSQVVAPPPGTEVLVSWFGAPESGLRGMNTRNRGMGFGGGGYNYAPLGKAEMLEDVRIGIWSTKAFVARWTSPSPAPGTVLDVDLQPVGTDRLAGTITNRLSVPLKDTIVAFGKQVYYNVGTIEPGASVQIESTLDRSFSQHLKEKRDSQSFLPANYYANQAENMNRADLLREIMFHDSDASGMETVPSRTHHDLDLSGQLALGRPMLVAQIDRPGTQLVLGNAPGEAKTVQTTILRVILPLSEKSEGESK